MRRRNYITRHITLIDLLMNQFLTGNLFIAGNRESVPHHFVHTLTCNQV